MASLRFSREEDRLELHDEDEDGVDAANDAHDECNVELSLALLLTAVVKRLDNVRVILFDLENG